MSTGNKGKVLCFFPFFLPPPSDGDVAMDFLMSQALLSETFSSSSLLPVYIAVFPITSQKAVFLLPAASQLVGDQGRWEFRMGHQFLELVSVIVFD